MNVIRRSVVTALAGFAFAAIGAHQARAQFIDHEGGCRQWERIAHQIYANYQTKYKSLWSLGRSQAADVEAEARAKDWNEDYIKHLLLIVSDAASGEFASMEQIGLHVFSRCMATWRLNSTAEQRAAEAKEVHRRRSEAIATEEKRLADGKRAMACSEYQGMAWQIIALQRSGMTYQQAANWAAGKAYGPDGQVLRFSEANGNAYMALAAAVYFARVKYGKSDQAFARRAYEGCMRGELSWTRVNDCRWPLRLDSIPIGL